MPTIGVKERIEQLIAESPEVLNKQSGSVAWGGLPPRRMLSSWYAHRALIRIMYRRNNF